MSKSNSLFGLKNRNKKKFIPPTQKVDEKPEIIRRKSVKISEEIRIEKRNKKLDVVIVSVNYNDFLIITLENNLKIFENITVVTSHEDTICQEICKKFGIKCIKTNVMYENGDSFNKGKAINEGIKSIKNADLILLLDADIIVTENIDLDNLNDEVLYTSDRWICFNYFQYDRWSKNNVTLQNIGKWEEDKGFGFFQLFNYNNESINKDVIFPINYEDASNSDLVFRDSFKTRENISVDVIHLGDIKKNWKGRITNKFITNEIFNNKLSNIRNTGIKISNYEEIVKNNIRIISNIKFNLKNGGIYNPDIIYENGKKYIIARCEKNYDSYTGIYENYWKSLINPMFFEIDDDYFVKSHGVFRMLNFPIRVRYEDFRTFEHNGKIITNHNITTPNYEYKGGSNWTNMNISTKPGIIVSTGLSEVDIQCETISNIENIDLGISKLEKNWSFFTIENELHFIYSIDPFIVYKKVDKQYIKVIDKKYNYSWNSEPDSKMKYCISTNLKRLNNEYYILFFHTKVIGYKYTQGCILINNNLEPVYMTKNPILESTEMRGKFPNVLYVFSVDVKDDEIDVFYGESDTNCCVAIIDKVKLIENITMSINSHKIKEVI